MSKQRVKTRVSRDQWLAAAMDLFARVGESGLTIHRLAREVGVAKAGFYWHFQDRADLLDTMIDYWTHEFTEVVTSNPVIWDLPAEERLLEIFYLVDKHNLEKFESPMRAWAANDPDVAARMGQAYELRLEMVRQILRELDFEGEALEMRAQVLVCYGSNQRTMFGELCNQPEKKRIRMARLLYDLITAPD